MRPYHARWGYRATPFFDPNAHAVLYEAVDLVRRRLGFLGAAAGEPQGGGKLNPPLLRLMCVRGGRLMMILLSLARIVSEAYSV